MSFSSLGLRPELLQAVAATGYTQPTPIQLKAVPAVLRGQDVLAGAQTGTGKTAAFALPILQLLDQRPRRPGNAGRAPRALVLTPTRELAAQVAESFETYGRNLRLKSAVVFGGVGINPQKDALRRGVDILVATPGRLLDLAGQGSVDLSGIEVLVLDEADRMLDMGFIRDIRRVLALLPRRRQNLLFSATYAEEVKKLADSLLKEPAQIEVARRNTAAEKVTQHVYRVDKAGKRDLLIHLIDDGEWSQVLVFTRTKHGANRLAEQLVRAGIEAAAIHGNKSQGARTQALAGFKAGRLRVLVATDIAARGLDIDRLPHVVNYELPNVPEDYVHRIGRTGRAGEEGAAVSLVGSDEVKLLRAIERVLRRSVQALAVPDFEPKLPAVAPSAGRSEQTRQQRGAGSPPPQRPHHAKAAAEIPAQRHRQRSRRRTSTRSTADTRRQAN